MINVVTLMDDASSENLALKAEHGLSFFIEAGKRKFLFDCGASSTTILNAYRLGVELKSVEFTVCSHSHYDHAAGFRDMAEAGMGGKVLYTGNKFFERKYAYDGVKFTDLSCGFDEGFLDRFCIEHKVCADITEVAEGCWLVGNFPRKYAFETIPQRFVRGLSSAVADDFCDEICLAMKCDKGLVVLVGCSHPGILNMVSRVHDALKLPIYAVFGGTHLIEADGERINTTIDVLCGMGLSVLGLSHCSGAAAEAAIARSKRVKSCHLGTGDCISL